MNIETKRTLRKWRLAYIDPLQRSLHRAWSWWTGELMELMPPSFREFIERRSRRLLVEFMGNDLIILEGHADRVQVLKRVPVESANESLAGLSRGARDTALIVPSDKILSKALTLPLAAEENLYEVLGFEMDRHTPFSADQVYYDFSITGRSVERQELSLVLFFAPRKIVDGLVELASSCGIPPTAATSREAVTERFTDVNLLPATMRAVTPRAVNRLNLALSCLAALLLVTTLLLPIAQKQYMIGTLASQLEEQETAAGEAIRLQTEVEKLAEGSEQLMQKKQSNLLVLQVIDEMSRIVPDDTWIDRLDINGDEVLLQGQSTSSAALIGLIESSTVLHNVRFRAPVTQVAQTGSERFQLSANVVWAREQ